jgi:peptidoglycan/xylan/chitin deacetylase (PgdA/CDA1 family)
MPAACESAGARVVRRSWPWLSRAVVITVANRIVDVTRALLAFAGQAVLAGIALALVLATPAAQATRACERPLYLTFDTGHMGVAPLVADVLARQQVKVSFFLANEKTLTNGSSLDDSWGPWWRDRAAEGHVFGSHTLDHVYWRADLPGGGFITEASAGPRAGQKVSLSAEQYCAQLQASAQRFHEMTGRTMAPLFRAPGGKTSPALLRAAARCGWQHVGWSPAGFLGDELPSQSHPNAELLDGALRKLRAGDILLAHLGIWSRQDAWAPAVLEPLLIGLKARGFCFDTLASHPQFGAAVAAPRMPRQP